MHPVKAIAIGLLAWPAAEVVMFFCVVAAVGLIKAVVLLVAMSAAGLLVLRRFGGSPQTIRTADGFVTASTWNGGIAPGLGGIFLLIPGFLTTVVGVLVLFPPTRRWLVTGFRLLFATRPGPAGNRGVIDLAPDEWRPLPAEKLPPSGRASPK